MPSSFNYSPPPTAGSVTATASGKLSDGSKVILNSDGTVSVIAATGSSTLLSTNNAAGTGSVYGDRRCVIGVYDSVNDVIVIWYINSSNNYLYAIAAKIVSGIITFGTPTAVNSTNCTNGVTYGISAAYDPINNYHYCLYVEVSSLYGSYARLRATGTSIGSIGVFANYWAIGSYVYPQGYSLIISPTLNGAYQQALISYHSNSMGQQLYQVCKMAASTINFGSEYVLSTQPNNYPRVPCFVTASVAVIPYRNTSDYNAISVVTLSNTTGTISNQTAIDTTSATSTANAKAISYNAVTGNLFCVFTAGTTTRGVLITLNGTTPTIGTVNTVVASLISDPWYCVAYPPTNDFWVQYESNAYRIIPSGTTFTVGSAQSYSFAVTTYYYGNLIYNPANYSLVVSGGTTPQMSFGVGYTSTLNFNNFLGISSASYATGSAATIQTIGSVDDAQSGLTAGTDYYVSPSGVLDSVATGQPYAGLALSPTRLLIKG
jgi:hypothetical protein